MSELLNLVQAQWPYALALVIGFPLALVVLNEAGFALARAGRPVAASVRFIRTWVAPLVALVLFLKWVVLLPSTGLWMRLTESLCWAVSIVAVIGIINNVVFESALPGTWQRRVPRLLRDLLHSPGHRRQPFQQRRRLRERNSLRHQAAQHAERVGYVEATEQR